MDINSIIKQEEQKVDGVQKEVDKNDQNRFIDSEQILDKLDNGN